MTQPHSSADFNAEAAKWWRRDRHADRRPALILRNAIKAALRTHFTAGGFVEVEPACLQTSPGNETHLHAFKTTFERESGASFPLYLHTSPEFAMKKLLAAGETRIFAFAPVFRNRESGPRHAAEFTMLEWYRASEPLAAIMADCTEIVRVAARVAGRDRWSYLERTVSPLAAPQTISCADAFARYASIDLLVTLTGTSKPDRDALAAQCEATGIRVAGDDTWSDLFSRILATRVEAALAAEPVPVFLVDYPTHEAALARPAAHDPRVAERFELYVAGLELANCFGELTDAAEQRRRFEAEMDEKTRRYNERYPIDDDFIAALGTMPPASGGALGFDRLVMLAAGASRIDQVQWTPLADGPGSELS